MFCVDIESFSVFVAVGCGIRWSRRAIKSFAMGELEARKLKYPTTGTEALLMGLLIEGNSLCAFWEYLSYRFRLLLHYSLK